MSKLIEKMSYEKRKEELIEQFGIDDLANDTAFIPPGLQKYIAEQVELAYQAGYLRFNGVSYDTCIFDETTEGIVKHKQRWHTLEEEFPLTGPDSILPSLYSQSKGFKP